MTRESPSRESERRFASVMFADVSGFTSMSERLDPEDVTRVMNQCFAMVEDVVRSHGGYVDKYIGDCIMALFGVPSGLEDAATRAVNAAIEIRARLQGWNENRRGEVSLDVHIGINTGLVIAGEVGGALKRDFTVLGDAVNVASRLKDSAPTGSIYVGAETYRCTREVFDYRQLAPLAVKGKKESLPAFEVLSQHERIHRPRLAGGDRRIVSDLVGRQIELGQLTDAISAVIGGRGGIVNLMGEAGIGKSRLIAEATARHTPGTATILEGRSVAVGQSLRFHPFVDLLRQWAGIADDAGNEEEAIATLEASVRRLVGAGSDEIFPFVATLMGMRLTGTHFERIKGIEGEPLEKLILKSVRELFCRMAAATPLVLVFEDLHWADRSSLRLLEPLFRLVEHNPVLFVNVFRPHHEDTAERLLRLAQETVPDRWIQIRLDRLTDKECDLLIQNLLKRADVPYATRALIWQKAEGNAFFIEEVLRSLIDDGIIQYSDGEFRITERIHSVLIPATIQDVLMARVDRLGEATRRVLQVASVIGRSFYRRIIADLMGDHANLDADLAVLKEKQLIFERRTRRTGAVRRRMLTEEIEYVFKHALAQETVYESILQRTRKQLHLRVAQSIEANFSDRLPDFYGMLAYHYSRAESLDKAEKYLFKAGDEAARSAASSEALIYFREASRLYFLIHGDGGDKNRKALLEKNIGLALLNRGDLMDCVQHFDRALELLGAARPASRLGVRVGLDLLAVLYRLYVPRRRQPSPGALRQDQEVLEIHANRARAQATSDPQRFFFDTIAGVRYLNGTDATAIDEAWWMYAGAAALFAFSGVSFRVSERFLEIAKGLIREQNRRDLFVYRSMQFVHHYLRGDWEPERAIDPDLVEQGLRYGQLWDVCAYLGFLCDIKAHQGEFAAVRGLIDKIIEISDVFAYDFAKSFEYAYTAISLLEQRRLKDALAASDAYYTARHEEVLNVLALGMKAKAQLLLDDRNGVQHTLAATEAIIARVGRISPWHLSEYQLSRFAWDLLLLETGVREGGRSSVRQLNRRAKASGKKTVRMATKVAKARTEAFKLAGRLRWLLGQQDAAAEWWTRSLAEGERLGTRPEIARTYLEIAVRLGEPASTRRDVNGLDARACRQRARQMFVEMGLTWDLERLDARGAGDLDRLERSRAAAPTDSTAG